MARLKIRHKSDKIYTYLEIMKCISLEYKSICFEIHLSDEIRNEIKLSIKHFMLSLRLLFKIGQQQI